MPDALSSVIRKSRSTSEVANSRTVSAYACAYVSISRAIAPSDSALRNPSSASDAAIRCRSHV